MTQTSPAKNPEPKSPPVRWGIMGTGRITEKLGPAMQKAANSEIVAVGSRTLESAKEWAKKYNVPHYHGSYEALLKNPEIDAIYLPLPNSLHKDLTIKAADHGKHVLCEKPLGLSAMEVKEMLAACQQNNVLLMDGTMWYHHPRCRDMMNKIHTGALGEVRKVTSAFSFCWHEEPDPKKEYRLSPEYGGGSLYDVGWYCVGATLKIMQTMPKKVWATARYHPDHFIDMGMSAVMWFEGNRHATFDCAFDTCFRNWLEVAGTTHSLVCDDFVLAWDEEKTRFFIHDEMNSREEFRSKQQNQIVSMIEDFCQIVLSGDMDYSWCKHSLDTQIVCDAILHSARTGEIVTL
jgi:predicted dehydrogenase